MPLTALLIFINASKQIPPFKMLDKRLHFSIYVLERLK